MPTPGTFTEEQLAAARRDLWSQAGDALLTQESLQEFIERFGLVPFAPSKLGLTAPSLVEATLGAANEAPSAAQTHTARELVGRMADEGVAMALNLTGSGGDTPDFVASAEVFRWVYTLRGEKNWKNAPATSGAGKVSPLALRVYETLAERGAMNAAGLAAELGREVTEAAIGRALSELWQLLRVLPVYAQGDSATTWELSARRFSRAIKAGVNAGQPTALSALVSLYLTQAVAATEDEVETFLSPLAARSRVREVLHALRSARELEEAVVAGKTLLHISGALPAFAEVEAPVQPEGEAAEEQAAPAAKTPVRFSETETPEPGKFDRIRRFKGDETRGPAREGKRPGAFGRSPSGRDNEEKRGAFRAPRANREETGGDSRPRRPFDRERPASDRERRPFNREGRAPGGNRPSFGRRNDAAGAGSAERKGRPAFGRKNPREGGFSKPSGDRPPRRPFRPEGEGAEGSFAAKRPFRPREQKPFSGDRGERKPFAPRGDRKPFGEKRPFRNDRGPGREAENAAGKRPFSRERKPFAAGEREPRSRKPFAPRGEGEQRERRPFSPRAGQEARPPRSNFGGQGRRDQTSGAGKRSGPPRAARPGGRGAYGGGQKPAGSFARRGKAPGGKGAPRRGPRPGPKGDRGNEPA